MNAASLTMAPAVEAIHRSHSTPDLPKEPPPSGSLNSHTLQRVSSLKSLPSLPAFDVPSFDFGKEFETSFRFEGKKTESKRRSTIANEKVVLAKTETTPAITVVTQADTLSRRKSMIDRPRSWLPSSKSSPNVRSALQERSKHSAKDNAAVTPEDKGAKRERSRTVESFADFAKQSWISRSRTPSPPSKAKRVLGLGQAHGDRHATSKLNTSPETRQGSGSGSVAHLDVEASRSSDSLSSASRALNRASIYLTRMKQKPQNVFSKSSSSLSLSASSVKSARSAESDSTALSGSSGATTTNNSTATATATAAAAATLAATPIASKLMTSAVLENTALPTTPRNSSHTASSIDTTTTGTGSENASQSTTDTHLTMPHPTSRDPLWATFRTLDLDFAKFTAKNTTAARMGVVRCTLVPFLRNTAHHPSNRDKRVLCPEDIDRRTTILSKWWNGLLEMLDGGQSRFHGGYGGAGYQPTLAVNNLQPVAGVDRPTLLEAATMIMMRPEWRLLTSYFQPLAERSPAERVRARSGTQSTTGDSDCDSSSAWILAESAEHNVRTMFVNNLLAQMALVVDKMSLRHAPLSLVNWCGKACAYAFFFAPGIADVLVRLWVLNGDLLRRVASEFGLPKKDGGESEDIVALFPPHLSKLGWTSVKSLADKLRVATKLPLVPAKIPWHGPWVSRWRGGDTDLFFIFCKYYYILAEEFMFEGLPLVEKARAPAFVLLHAQLLATLDSTIHRQASLEAMLAPPLSVNAALTAALPLPSNLLKGMDENRLVILLRDMLAENSMGIAPGIQHAFAQAFMAIMKAATKRTSRYEHAACFMLCDFLEETLLTYDAFQNAVNNSIATSPREGRFEVDAPSRPADYIDWPFWFDVGRMIMDSNNTMSEIRIMSFIFAVWDAIAADPARKETVCLDWLLSEEVFARLFNNWCPMVRAYYMRLLCWRVCRDSGSANELDVKIFLVVSQRLKTVWSHHLWLKQSADAAGRVPPSTAPCHPAPGKRFMIIRTEVQPPQPGLLMGFDSTSSFFSAGANAATNFRGGLNNSNGDSSAGNAKSDPSSTSYKKKWSLLGKVLSFSAAQANLSLGASNAASGTKRTWDDELEQARRETAASRSAAARAGPPSLFQPTGPPPPPKQSPATAVTPSSDSGSSTGSAPVFDAVTFVFRFALTWQGANGGGPNAPPRDRILTRPRLPAPAQARVRARSATLNGSGSASESTNGSAVFRSESPPPIALGLPPETRRVSGLPQTGLISEARNARPLSSIEGAPIRASTDTMILENKRLALGVNVAAARLVGDAAEEDEKLASQQSPVRFSASDSDAEFDRGRSPDFSVNSDMRGRHQANSSISSISSIQPLRPAGIHATGAVYAGRALAEWSLIVNECNSFVDRRRDEGVLGLSDVEVPMLGVDGLGLRQRA
ncbi:hypothetical protein QBC46DRAFT_18648 [Diplogelasinospora grovesii]|uniref:Uncharacterized protein n=1 Tax=Diplogelasinospora grovesii TaxID=303347 RepID=A0AAN6N2K4_9PEZI|nr:hypothetical protein QBC46DRAFT_18648 [Diplogelasinospora grovesii]